MNILVCLKQVPKKDAPIKLNAAGTWIDENVPYEVNEPDAYALEEALRLKEKHGGEVVVLTAGPARAQAVLREALAKGATCGIHVLDEAGVLHDPVTTARAIHAATESEQFDMVFTGLQSDDGGFAQTGVLLAELLGWPHASIIIGIERTKSGVRLKRELEAGQYQFLDAPLPCMVTIQSGINKLRYATLMGIKQAKNKTVRQVPLAELQNKLSSSLQRIERLYVPVKQKTTVMLEGAPVEIAKKLIEVLRNEVRVI